MPTSSTIGLHAKTIRNYQPALDYAATLRHFKYSQSLYKQHLKAMGADIYSAKPLTKDNFPKLAFDWHSFDQDLASAKEAFGRVEMDYSILSIFDEDYPDLLRKTSAAPPFLFVRGDITLLQRPCVAVVGTRLPSLDGQKRAQKLALLLSSQGYVVTSGLAKGIDTAAHYGAIKAGGKTIAVIGTPLDHSYPKENTSLQEIIANSHLLVSQFPFGHPVSRYNFPARNYTMSGITAATVIVEAGETSGALIQAQQCLKQGRSLFMLKNLIENPELRWPKQYRERGAIVIDTISDLTQHIPALSGFSAPSLSAKIQMNFFH